MKEKGMILSSLVYSLLIFFLLLLLGLLGVMWYRQNAINILRIDTNEIYDGSYIVETKLSDLFLSNVGTSGTYENKNDYDYFVGLNPNNWIEFGQASISDDTPLIWRIIKHDNEGIKLIFEGLKDGVNTPALDGRILIDESVTTVWDSTNNKWLRPSTLSSELSSWYTSIYIKNINNFITTIPWCIGGVTGGLLTDYIAQQCIDQTTSGGSFIGYSSLLGYSMINPSDYISTSASISCTASNQTDCGTDNYLLKTYSYWTSNAYATDATNIWYVNSDGSINYTLMNSNIISVRPVINIDPNAIWNTGNGTLINPYTIK